MLGWLLIDSPSYEKYQGFFFFFFFFFLLKISFFCCKIFNVFEYACFRIMAGAIPYGSSLPRFQSASSILYCFHIHQNYTLRLRQTDRFQNAHSQRSLFSTLDNKVSCILCHQGVQLILDYSWARIVVLAAVMGRWGMLNFFCVFTFIHFPLSPLSLSFISSTISSISLRPFSGRRHKMTQKG